MAHPAAFSDELWQRIRASKLFVVGAGGIGCELLKNLVLTGFEDIEIIDLDTIDVSNLNRQFLFHKKHVGKSKALVARESVLRFNPKAKITAHHGSIISPDYGLEYFKKFNVVLNALDNLAARSHVNRRCLSVGVPLIDCGTAGYQGQVEVIAKGLTQCYECLPKPRQKTYATCTIRNHPSEHIHCIIWAKHLFNQLYGEGEDEDITAPDFTDPEMQASNAEPQTVSALRTSYVNSVVNGSETRTPAQVRDLRFSPRKLFERLFNRDIKYLQTMVHLWKNRKPPMPLDWDCLPDANEGSSKSNDVPAFKDLIQWTIAECRDVFTRSINSLEQTMMALGDNASLRWDKDDDTAMDFVAAVANIRACIFNIPLKTRFEIKAMAGNIIPAIASSNAVIAGIVTLQTLKILKQELNKCTSVYLRKMPNARGVIIVPEKTFCSSVPNCYICSNKPFITLVTNIDELTCGELESEVLRKTLKLEYPDVMLNEWVVISGEETDHTKSKPLSAVKVTNGSCLLVEEVLRNFSFRMFVEHSDSLDEKFTFIGDLDKFLELKAQVPESSSDDMTVEEKIAARYKTYDDGDESDCVMLDDINFVDCYNSKKRKLETTDSPSKRLKTDSDGSSKRLKDSDSDEDPDVIVLD